MDSCVEIKILLIKNEGKKSRKDKPEINRERELIAIRQKLKSEREPRNKKKNFEVFCTLNNMEKEPGRISRELGRRWGGGVTNLKCMFFKMG